MAGIILQAMAVPSDQHSGGTGTMSKAPALLLVHLHAQLWRGRELGLQVSDVKCGREIRAHALRNTLQCAMKSRKLMNFVVFFSCFTQKASHLHPFHSCFASEESVITNS